MADFSLDHVLIAVRDLDRAARAWTAGLGLTLSPEGVHPGRGTHNRLIVFHGEYLELIAFRDGSEGAFRPTMADLLDRRQGLYMFALGTDDIGKAVSDLRSRGVDVEDPVDGAREGGNGAPGYTWKSAAIPAGATPGSETFIIQHDNTMTERYREPRGLFQHPSGATGVHSLEIAVGDAEAAASSWQAVFGLQPPELLGELTDVGERRARLRLRNCFLDFVSPTDSGELSRFLESNGEAPYRLSLHVTDLAATADALVKRGVTATRGVDSDGKHLEVASEHTSGVSLRFI
jgi:catechol 2,3-dioxygenase-like lactoylglutathione lyase family enzyme